VSLRGQDTPTLPLAGLRVGPFSRTAVVGAPFSAVATTVVIRRNPDGTRVRLMGTWRVYRDSNGRVRVDWVAPAPRGQAGAGTSTQKMSVLKLGDGRDEGGHPLVYIVDSVRRTFRALGGMSAGTFFNAETTFAIPTGVTSLGAPTFYMFLAADVHATNGAARQSLGQARIEGLEADGWRATLALPSACRVCDEHPGVQIEERWESRDLQVVVFARHLDRGDAVPVDYLGKGIDIEYRLTNIVRNEPPAELFVMPPNYVRHWGGPGDPDVSLGGPWPAHLAVPADRGRNIESPRP
jgi:hypothetical protein